MLQNQVSRKNLDDLIRESRKGEKAFLKGMFARIQVEDPLCGVMIQCLADNARAQLLRDKNMSATELHQLVVDACTLVVKLRYLAEEQAPPPPSLNKILMEDPDETSGNSSALDAQEETLMLLELMRMGHGRKNP